MKKTASLLAVLLLFSGIALAQTRTVKGIVRDPNGNPVPLATVTEAGTSNAIKADADGAFSINVPANARLTISASGFTTQTISSDEAATIVLPVNQQQMQEVVVTALGIRREKRQLTYSTQEVKGETVVQAKQDNIVNGLAGKVAGVQVSNSSGMAGSSSRITIRGNVSLLQDNQPLFVVDGVPIDNSEPGGIDVFSQGVNNTALSQGSTSNRAIDIDPSIIEM